AESRRAVLGKRAPLPWPAHPFFLKRHRKMEVRYSAAAHRALGELWNRLMLGSGTGDSWIEFYDGAMPPSPDDKHTAALLARLYIKPHTLRVESENALRSGEARWARIVGTDGRALVDFDVTTKGGGGLIEFNTL